MYTCIHVFFSIETSDNNVYYARDVTTRQRGNIIARHVADMPQMRILPAQRVASPPCPSPISTFSKKKACQSMQCSQRSERKVPPRTDLSPRTCWLSLGWRHANNSVLLFEWCFPLPPLQLFTLCTLFTPPKKTHLFTVCTPKKHRKKNLILLHTHRSPMRV
jgi:hypothetical protein